MPNQREIISGVIGLGISLILGTLGYTMTDICSCDCPPTTPVVEAVRTLPNFPGDPSSNFTAFTSNSFTDTAAMWDFRASGQVFEFLPDGSVTPHKWVSNPPDSLKVNSVWWRVFYRGTHYELIGDSNRRLYLK